MLIWERTFLPTGELAVDEAFDTALIHRETLAGYEAWWRANESTAETSVQTPVGSLKVKFTFTSAGQALGTYSFDETPVLSCVMLAGLNVGGDGELVEMFLASMRKVEHVKRLSTDPLPFESLRHLRNYPAVGGVFWPSIPVDHFRQLVPVAMLFETSFFRTRSQTGS